MSPCWLEPGLALEPSDQLLNKVLRRARQRSVHEPKGQAAHYRQAEAASIARSGFVSCARAMIFIMGDPSGAKIRIAAEYGSSREAPALPAKMKTYEKLAAHTNSGGKMVHSIRSMGSAALNICYVATGGIDIYWEIGVSATWLYPGQALTTVLALGCLCECRRLLRTPCHVTARGRRWQPLLEPT